MPYNSTKVPADCKWTGSKHKMLEQRRLHLDSVSWDSMGSSGQRLCCNKIHLVVQQQVVLVEAV